MALLVIAAKDLPQPEEDAPAGPERPLELPAAVVEQADAALADPAKFVRSKDDRRAACVHCTGTNGVAQCSPLASGPVLAPAQFAWLKLVDRALWYFASFTRLRDRGLRSLPPSQPASGGRGSRGTIGPRNVPPGSQLSRPSVRARTFGGDPASGGRGRAIQQHF